MPPSFAQIRALRLPTFGSARALTVLGFFLSLGLLVSGAAIVIDLRVDTWRKAEQEASSNVEALSRDILHAIRLYDRSVQTVRDVMQRPDIGRLSPETRRMALFSSSNTTDALGAMLVLDAQGTTIADTRSANPPPINMADRDFFTAQRDNPDLGLFISRPYRSKLRQGDWSVAIGRRITGPDGGFGGIVSGALRLAWFQDMFSPIDVGPHGIITLFQANGRVVMRFPLREGEIDRDRSDDALFRRFAAGAAGHFTAPDSEAGLNRLYTFSRIGDLPLILSIGLAVDDIYAAWWYKAVVIGLVMAVLCAGSAVAYLLYALTIRRRAATEAALCETAERLERKASTDALTGLANRGAFDTGLAKEWLLAIRSGTPIALLMLDADYFKRYNDHYGHPKGDAVLRGIAACIQTSLMRPTDLGARVGGEEFAALMPATDIAGATEVAERIREAIKDLGIPHAEHPAGHVTVSIVCAVLRPAIGDTATTLVALADKALYDAKTAGRNRICTLSEDSDGAEAVTADDGV